MTANGADKETLKQIQNATGKDIPIDQLNEYLYTYVKGLADRDKAKLNIANSIWVRDDNGFNVEKDFLQKNADYYNAAVYKSSFNKQTVKDINNWAKKNTDGRIDNLLDKIDNTTVMYLINTVCFDAEWDHIYTNKDIDGGKFTAFDGKKQNVDFMKSDEAKFIDNGKAKGFVKPYAGGKFNFVAMLPNESVTVDDYISSLTGESFIKMIKNAKPTSVTAYLPKFEYKYNVNLISALKSLGITDVFDINKADLSKISKSSDDLYLNQVIHNTYIEVDERGTRAGAATVMGIANGIESEESTIRLDRPFVYAIIDNETNLPILIGTVMSIN
jgi:serpin B